MYITAQRVTRGEENGINAYFYTHGNRAWTAPPDPDEDCGELVDQLLCVEPGNNPVVSYLDIIAPEKTEMGKVRALLVRFAAERATSGSALPWDTVVEDCRLRLSMTKAYAKTWKQEMSILARACDVIYRSGSLLLCPTCGQSVVSTS